MIPFELSSNLRHTWFIDLDGTIFKHNGLWEDGFDTVLPGVKNLWKEIPIEDCIIITTARKEMWKEETIKILKDNDLRYDHLIFNLAHGERILINDIKPEQQLKTAIAWNVKRNQGF